MTETTTTDNAPETVTVEFPADELANYFSGGDTSHQGAVSQRIRSAYYAAFPTRRPGYGYRGRSRVYNGWRDR